MSSTIDSFPSARDLVGTPGVLPAGVVMRTLTTHTDERGTFTEVFREEWDLGLHPAQWNIVQSDANVLRGVHVHRSHRDVLTVVRGEMLLALRDIRPDSSLEAGGLLLRLSAADPHVISIPVGVAHGFYFAEPSTHLYAVDRYFDPADELGCQWNAPELGLKWPCTTPRLSRRDATAGDFAGMLGELRRT